MRIMTVPILAALALALAGCAGQSAADTAIATAGGASPSADASDGATEKLSDDERRLKFAECMREQGIEMADPGNGEGMRFRANRGADGEKMEAAMKACKDYAPNGGEPIKLNPEQAEQMRKFAKCMRENGVPDFPDPSADGRITVRAKPGAGMDPDSPVFKAATEKCRQFQPTRPPGRTR